MDSYDAPSSKRGSPKGSSRDAGTPSGGPVEMLAESPVGEWLAVAAIAVGWGAIVVIQTLTT
ncbi:MAG TPA: hypothetical protein VLU43_10105 [Anaeromyxobacteraceae bacterium]|nr:hypothetical protein [Anaeromyxobacteraceae bacterium]